jgi:hypothetical protein
MDHWTATYGTARVVEGGVSPKPDVDLAWKKEVEDVLELADRALRRSRPTAPAEDPSRRFLAAGQPARAPKAEETTLAPVSVQAQDGRSVLTENALKERLDSVADTLVQVDVETVVDIEHESRPIRIEYEFDRPVTAAENVHGQLFTLASGGRRVPFESGTQTTYLVQIIAPEQYPGDPTSNETTLHVHIEGTQATWTPA